MYLILKSLHIIAVVLFLGNIITGVFWKAHADRTGDPRLMAHVLDGIIRSDRWFTLPGVFLIVAFGVAGAMVGGIPIFRTSWIWQSIVLFAVSGLAFMLRVAPLQKRLRDLAREAAGGKPFDQEGYRIFSRGWAIWGVVATAAPIAALFLMVVKPAR